MARTTESGLPAAALALVCFCLGCASTGSPREFVNRLTTPNEGVRADLAQLAERVRQLEGAVADSASEKALLRERIAQLEQALEEVKAVAAASRQPAPFEPPPPARLRVIRVKDIDEAPSSRGPGGEQPVDGAETATGIDPETDPP